MIFAHTLDQVISGHKQQTRRIVKPDEIYDVERECIIKNGNRTLYAIGKTYAVQPNRGKKSVARILLTGLRQERVAEITDDDAKSEGFSSKRDFIEAWQKIHGHSANLEQLVWVLEFVLASIIADELRQLHEQRDTKNTCSDNGHDISTSLKGLSGIDLHGRGYRSWRMGPFISDRLPLSP